MIIEAIIVLVSVLFGWFLRDLQMKIIKEKVEQIKKKILPNKSRVLDWTPPQSLEEEAEKKVRKDLEL